MLIVAAETVLLLAVFVLFFTLKDRGYSAKRKAAKKNSESQIMPSPENTDKASKRLAERRQIQKEVEQFEEHCKETIERVRSMISRGNEYKNRRNSLDTKKTNK